MTITAPTNIQGQSIRELVLMMMPPAHERSGRHVSTSDEQPTITVDTIKRGLGRHRAEPIAVALYLDNKDRQARHRAQPDSLFALVNDDSI
jgi:hypothetical protein